MRLIIWHASHFRPGWSGDLSILAFAKVRNIFQTICFEPKSRHLKSVAWICPFSTRAVNTSGAIASFTNREGRKKERNVFITGPELYCLALDDNHSHLKVKFFVSIILLRHELSSANFDVANLTQKALKFLQAVIIQPFHTVGRAARAIGGLVPELRFA